MTTRILSADEYPKLKGTELETLWPVLPLHARVLVVEDEGRIVGCWAIYQQTHVEGIWIAPTHRKRGAVALRLIRQMKALVSRRGEHTALTASLSPEVTHLIHRLGGIELKGQHFAIPVGG